MMNLRRQVVYWPQKFSAYFSLKRSGCEPSLGWLNCSIRCAYRLQIPDPGEIECSWWGGGGRELMKRTRSMQCHLRWCLIDCQPLSKGRVTLVIRADALLNLVSLYQYAAHTACTPDFGQIGCSWRAQTLYALRIPPAQARRPRNVLCMPRR